MAAIIVRLSVVDERVTPIALRHPEIGVYGKRSGPIFERFDGPSDETQLIAKVCENLAPVKRG
jgi:hypothetical protein